MHVRVAPSQVCIGTANVQGGACEESTDSAATDRDFTPASVSVQSYGLTRRRRLRARDCSTIRRAALSSRVW
jgi:hypothetical protein